jgi:hypothetical protein
MQAAVTVGPIGKSVMAEPENDCMIVELIDDFFAEYLPAPGGSDKVDTEAKASFFAII